MKIVFSLYAWLMFGVFSSCGNHTRAMQFDGSVDSFAVHFFNWQFTRAVPFCTPESRLWLRYAASQVHPADVEVLRGKERDAVCEMADSRLLSGDSLAEVVVRVNHFVRMDTIGRAGRVIGSGTFRLHVVKREGRWQVRLRALPRMSRE